MNVIASRKEKPVGLRLPTDIREALDREAARNGRSRNSEIVVRLVESLGLRGANEGQGVGDKRIE